MVNGPESLTNLPLIRASIWKHMESKKRTGYQVILFGSSKLSIPTEQHALPKAPEADFIEADFTEVQ